MLGANFWVRPFFMNRRGAENTEEEMGIIKNAKIFILLLVFTS